MFKFNLLENEKIIRIYRQTESMLFKPALVVMVLIYFPWYLLLKYGLVLDYKNLLIIWTLAVLIYALNKYLLWLLNVNIITDKRLVCVIYTNLLNKRVLESPLNQILNVSFSIHGFWQSLVRFGSVEARAAGLSEPLLLKNLAKPSEAKDFIWNVKNQYIK